MRITALEKRIASQALIFLLFWAFLYFNPVEHILFSYQMVLMGLIPALIGMWLGAKIRYRISEVRFRRLFFMGLIALGGYMLLRTVVKLI